MALEDSTNPMQGVSGPGPYAKRTDLSYQSQSYGDGVAYDAAKSGAKLATAPKSPMLSEAPKVPTPQAPVTGLFEPTQRPNEPVTHGIDVAGSAGGGSEVLSMRQPDDNNFRAALSQYKPVLNFISDNPNTSPETRQAIADLWDNL
jgi:hypothetical protein